MGTAGTRSSSPGLCSPTQPLYFWEEGWASVVSEKEGSCHLHLFLLLILPLLFPLLPSFFLDFQESVFLCSPDCPETCFVDHGDLDLRESTCLCSQHSGIKGVHHHLASLPGTIFCLKVAFERKVTSALNWVSVDIICIFAHVRGSVEEHRVMLVLRKALCSGMLGLF